MEKKYWSYLLTVAIFAILIFFAIRDIDIYKVYNLLTQINLVYFALALACGFLTFIVWVYRWEYFFKKFLKVNHLFLLNVLFAGAFFNAVTPGAGVGGEPFKAWFLAKKYRKPKNQMLGLVLGDKFFHLASLFVFVIFSILFVLIYLNISNQLKLILEIVFVFIFLVSAGTLFLILKKLEFNFGVFFKRLYFFKFIKKRFKSSEVFQDYIDIKIKEFMKITKKIINNRKNLYFGFSLSFIYWLLYYAVFYYAFLSFGHQVNFLSIIVVVTIGSFLGMFAPIPGGIGLVEGGMVLLYSAMGVDFSLALLAAFLGRLIFYFYHLLIGGFSLIYLRMTLEGKPNRLF